MEPTGIQSNSSGSSSLPQAQAQAPQPQVQQPSPSFPQAASHIPYSPTSSSATHNSPSVLAPFTPVALKHEAESITPASTNGAGAISAPVSASNPRQRSSIACLHCRRSKIRCVNTGIDTQCHACRNSGRECRYSVEIFKRSRVGDEEVERTPKRSKSRKIDAAPSAEGAASSRGIRPEADAAATVNRTSSARGDGLSGRAAKENILDDGFLTPQVWTEIYEIFETHFGTELSFLHTPTFSKRLRESAEPPSGVSQPRKDGTASVNQGWDMLRLGILALTARMHSGLVDHLCRLGDSTKTRDAASEHFAEALRGLFTSSMRTLMTTPNLATIQALLMLALYEWGCCNGSEAWFYVGIAIRMAQSMGLQYEDDREILPHALSFVIRAERPHLRIGAQKSSTQPLDPGSNDAFIEEEMRRRTFWSCFVVEQYLGSGKFRAPLQITETSRLQLPCSQNAFLFGDRVCTAFIDGKCSNAAARTERKQRSYRKRLKENAGLGEEPAGTMNHNGNSSLDDNNAGLQIACESGSTESVPSLYVRLVAIWGRVARWACAGGTRSETYPPGRRESQFQELYDALEKFDGCLPTVFRFSKNNIEAHIAQRTSSAYILLQMLRSLCWIVLCREILPFLPLGTNDLNTDISYFNQRNKQPVTDHSSESVPWASGPHADHSNNFRGDERSSGPDWQYYKKSQQVFKSAGEVMELIQTCGSRCPLPETPIVAFALHTVALTGMYAFNFAHLDRDGFVCGMNKESSPFTGGIEGTTRLIEDLGKMESKIPMAGNWLRILKCVNHYYQGVQKKYDSALLSSPTSNGANPRNSLLKAGPEAEKSLEALDNVLRSLGAAVKLHSGLLSSDSAGTTHPLSPPQEAQAPLSENWAAHNAAGGPVDSALHPPSSGSGVRYQDSLYTSIQPPVLSRGSTPTPSADSMSPYSGPGGGAPGMGYAGDEAERERAGGYSHPHSHLLHQQLGHGGSGGSVSGVGSTSGGGSGSQASLANITSAYTQPGQHQQLHQRGPPPPGQLPSPSFPYGSMPSHSSPTALSRSPTSSSKPPLSPSQTHNRAPPPAPSSQSQLQQPILRQKPHRYSTDLERHFGGDDVAIFMDGVPFQEIMANTLSSTGSGSFSSSDKALASSIVLSNDAWSTVGAFEARAEGWLQAVLLAQCQSQKE